MTQLAVPKTLTTDKAVAVLGDAAEDLKERKVGASQPADGDQAWKIGDL